MKSLVKISPPRASRLGFYHSMSLEEFQPNERGLKFAIQFKNFEELSFCFHIYNIPSLNQSFDNLELP